MENSLDSRILKIFQRISDWSQINFGINNFVIAKSLLICYVIGYSLYLQRVFVLGLFNTFDIAWYIITPFYVGYLTSVIISSEREWKNNNPVFKNTAEYKLVIYRRLEGISLIFKLLTILSIIYHLISIKAVAQKKDNLSHMYEIVFNIMVIFRFLFVFFGSCTPKPPDKSRIKKFVDRFVDMVKLAPKLKTANV